MRKIMARTSLFAFVTGMLGCGSKAVDSEVDLVRLEAKTITLTVILAGQFVASTLLNLKATACRDLHGWTAELARSQAGD